MTAAQPKPTAAAETPQFEIRGLRKAFGKLTVLAGIDLQVARGRTTVIIGPSGCGKTVLLKHLVGLLKPDAGEVHFDGERIDNLSERQLIAVRKSCGYLFQAGALFDSMTVLENVAFPLLQHTDWPRKQVRSAALEKLALVGLEEKAHQMPADLSGGQQKRVALARAIALSPSAILYDEPTTGLDPLRSDTISDLILRLQRELHTTAVVVTHDMTNAAKIADRIIMLDEGRIIADGAPDEIAASEQKAVRRFIRGEGEHVGAKHSEGNQP